MTALHPRARALVDRLRLEPHVEGGYYREMFRAEARVRTADGRDRPAVTTIYFLLPGGAISRWHRVNADEVWHLYEGDGVELFVAPPELTRVTRVLLGAPIESDGQVHAVPAGWWQAARAVGPYAFAGCTVAPGFEFDDFSLLGDDPAARARITALGGEAAALI